MFDPIRKIGSHWETEKRWVEGMEQKSSTDISTRELTMHIITEGHERPILRFEGGPTGFESYYVADIDFRVSSGEDKFYICAGTANRWPACWVDRKEVQKFVDEFKAVAKII